MASDIAVERRSRDPTKCGLLPHRGCLPIRRGRLPSSTARYDQGTPRRTSPRPNRHPRRHTLPGAGRTPTHRPTALMYTHASGRRLAAAGGRVAQGRPAAGRRQGTAARTDHRDGEEGGGGGGREGRGGGGQEKRKVNESGREYGRARSNGKVNGNGKE